MSLLLLRKRALTLIIFFLVAMPQVQAWLPSSAHASANSDGDNTMAAYDAALAKSNSAVTPSLVSTTTTISSLTSLDDYFNLIENTPKDSLVVVKYYAKVCPLCRRVAPKYKKMARMYQQQQQPIHFCEIEKSVCPTLFDTMQVTTFPFIQVFRNGLCIASHGTQSLSTFEPIVKDTVQHFLNMNQNEQHWNAFLTTFQEPIAKATSNLDTMKEKAGLY